MESALTKRPQVLIRGNARVTNAQRLAAEFIATSCAIGAISGTLITYLRIVWERRHG